jgi:hypothetical protein
MPDLNFRVEHAEAVPFAAAPLIAFRVRVENANAEETIHTVALRVQIQIETTRRGYDRQDQERLLDLFGEPNRWAQTLRPMLWTHASVVIPAFAGNTLVDLQVPCTFDFNIAATKYFHALSGGDIPLQLMFSGNTFYTDTRGSLQVAPISWDKEARFKLPVTIWKEMMDLYYPNSAWLCLRRDVFERLLQYKMRRGMPTWEQALESVIPVVEDEVVRS